MLGDALSIIEAMDIHSKEANDKVLDNHAHVKLEASVDGMASASEHLQCGEKDMCLDDDSQAVQDGESDGQAPGSFSGASDEHDEIENLRKGHNKCSSATDIGSTVNVEAAEGSSTVNDFALLITQLAALDDEGIFQHPVSVDLYPDYAKCIPMPMDFSSMLEKNKQGEYSSAEQVALDFLLICADAAVYNHHSMRVHTKALFLLVGGLPLLWPHVPQVAAYHVTATLSSSEDVKQAEHDSRSHAASHSGHGKASGARNSEGYRSGSRTESERRGMGANADAHVEAAAQETKAVPLYINSTQTRAMRDFLHQVRLSNFLAVS